MAEAYQRLSESVYTTIGELKELVLLWAEGGGPEFDAQLVGLDAALSAAEAAAGAAEQHLVDERQRVREASALLKEAAAVKARVDHMVAHAPARLPGGNSVLAESRDKENTPMDLSDRERDKRSADEAGAADPRPAKKRSAPPPPKIEYVSKGELDSISGFMKGRLTLDRINASVDDINTVIAGKARILATPMAKLTGLDLKRYKAHKDTETPECKGHHYFVEDDIKNAKLPTFKMDPAGRSILTILRTLGRLREIRGGGVCRYALRRD